MKGEEIEGPADDFNFYREEQQWLDRGNSTESYNVRESCRGYLGSEIFCLHGLHRSLDV